MSSYDFIVVGAGTAGGAVAWRLASSAKRPSVLLLEAGGDNSDNILLADGERWTTVQVPGLNWGYETTPQEHLNGRVIGLHQGKGLGGSSFINFGAYVVPPRADFEEIARLTGSTEWQWDLIKERCQRLETYHDGASDAYRKHLEPTENAHGTSGPLHIGHPDVPEKSCPYLFNVLLAAGVGRVNKDTNDGDPIGISHCPNSAYRGRKTSSKDLILAAPNNLSIVTGATAERILFQDEVAIGVQANGVQYFASNEVIMSAGTINTPRLCMISGIGPAEVLSEHGINIVKDVPRMGRGLKDHLFWPLIYRRADGLSDRVSFYRNDKAVAAARKQWETDSTGPLNEYATALVISFLKSDGISKSKEFQDLPKETQRHLQQETVPHFHFIMNGPNFADLMNPKEAVAMDTAFAFLCNAQSEGEVTIKSADVNDPPVIKSNLFSHPYDRRVAIEATRTVMEFAEHPAYAENTVGPVAVPTSKSDQDILAHVQQTAGSAWTMTSTAKMGKRDDPQACVSDDFKVMGIEHLRIADLSVLPIITTCHTQSIAYVTGLTCGDQLVREYSLD